MSATYDAIVLGVGGMGSATLYHLARRGLRVLGIERFDVPHDMGSSHGITRIIRLAYYEHPAYVPLLRRAYELWDRLEDATGRKLLYRTGSLDVGPPEGDVFAGSLESCRRHGLDHQVLSAREVNQRWPAFRLPEGMSAVFQPDGGFLLPEECIVAHVEMASRLGARVHARERVLEWEETAHGGVRVVTDRGSYEADVLVVTAGAWAAALLPELEGLAVSERQVLGWFQPRRPELFHHRRFPVFILDVPEGHYYGFPVFKVPGFKIGLFHHLGEPMDPDHQDREPRPQDEEVLRRATRAYFPDGDGPTMALKTCMFTNSPDEHFILDRLPGRPQVCVGAGFSGHGFKFAAVVGEILADLAQKGSTGHDVAMFSISRFGGDGE